MNIAFKKTEIKYFTYIIITFTFIVKSIKFHKFNLSTFIHVENIFLKTSIIIISLFTYQAISFFSFTYKIIILKTYFIIADLYMRYALLSKLIIIYIIIMLFIIFI